MAAGGLAALVPVNTARARTTGPADAPRPGDKVTTTYPGHSPFGFDQWASVQFVVPQGVNRITVSRTFDHYDGLPGIMADVLDIGLYGPSGFRGWSGGARDGFTVSGADATPGYLPGPVEPGSWSVALGPVVFNPAGMNWQVVITLEYGDPLTGAPYAALPTSVPGRGESWYRGDMHTHTVFSDGGRTLAQLVAEARTNGLDFLGSTEHNTSSAGVSWAGSVPPDLLVVNGEEVTTRHGHWLALGLPQGEFMDWHFSPHDSGVLARHADHVRDVGGLVVAAHPLTPAPGSFWEFGFDDVDAIEVWNGPWTLDDEAAVAMWATMLFLGRRIPAVGNSDTHFAPGDVVGLPQTVVHATSLSRAAVLDGVRHGRSYLAESAQVTLNLTARCGGRQAGPGDSLPVSFSDPVEVTVTVTGAPGTILALHTEWGPMLATTVGGDGHGRLDWHGWGIASVFARAEVRRPEPGSSTLDQMVALSNPVWFGPAPAPRPVYEGGQTFLFASRHPDGSWTTPDPVPGVGTDPTFAGPQAAVAAMPDGSTQLLGLRGDNSLWFTDRSEKGSWRAWRQLAGPGAGSRATPTAHAAATVAGTAAVRATGASKAVAPLVASGPTAGTLAAGPAGTAAGVVMAGSAFREAAIAALPDGSSQIIATGIDGTLYHQVHQADGRKTGFAPVPGKNGGTSWTAVKAAIAGMSDGSAQILGFGSDGNMYLTVRRADGTWSDWTLLTGHDGAATFSGPALAITGMPDGSSQIAAIGIDGNVFHRIRSAAGTYTGFAPCRGVAGARWMAAGSIAIAGTADGCAQLAVVGSDGKVWHCLRHADGGWTDWARPTGPNSDSCPGGQVRLTATPDGSTRLVVITPS
ncbi:CehA/McbA family metallohydrolase [Streptomyces sp. NPDC051133]|uniref:CehA/McbA family metallohydrolase n=1 Tax=Streptomyces sp. NPDC051133 TaxID=3155521 RepID=UPI00342879AB